MIRKLLKKKLKIIATKKLKTISKRRSALGQWALRQLFFIQSNKLAIFFPGVHRNPLEKRRGAGDYAVAQPISAPHNSQPKQIISSQLTGATLFGRAVQCPDARGGGGAKENASRGDNPWARYPLRLVSAVPCGPPEPGAPGPAVQKCVHNHWKNIYSLDQLMSHQFDSQLRLRCSPHKRRLQEVQKLSALYGKLSSKKQRGLFGGNGRSNLSTNIHNIPRILEMRLDAAVRQCFAFSTFSAARHWISQGRILVNGQSITSPNHGLSVGDLVSIAAGSSSRYKKQLLELYYSQPREKKYCASGQLMQRWKEWAGLYGRLQHHHPLAKEPAGSKVQPTPAIPPSPVWADLGLEAGGSEGQSFWDGTIIANDGRPPHSPFSPPRKKWGGSPYGNIQSYWYATGRFAVDCLAQLAHYYSNVAHFPQYRPCGRRLAQWLRKHPWPSTANYLRRGSPQGRLRPYRFYFNNWRAISRRKMFVFSQWLIHCAPLISDGLYHCRWLQPLMRKKSAACNQRYKRISLQKPLHFEICHRKQAAVLLYPPQKLLWPYMIDLKKLCG